MNPVKVPSLKGVGDSLGKYAQGVLGGIVYRTASQFLGNGLIGGALSSALAGSVFKGTTGDMVAVSMGVNTGVGIDLLGMVSGGSPTGDSSDEV